ncbi:MAG: RDD family protein [Planctomycetes bacterium]|nr:RDD family protein [Planctomycetota bacterium]
MPCLNHPDVITGLENCSRCGKEFCGDCVITLRGQTICAACKAEKVQDIKSGAETGELDAASRGARLGAAIVDTLVAVAIILPLFFALGVFSHVPPKVGSPMWLTQNVLPAVLLMIYEALMLKARGQTLGKMALGLKVVTPDDGEITAGQAWGRAASRSLMGLTQILGLVDALFVFSKPRTCLHDRIAKTRVVNWKR